MNKIQAYFKLNDLSYLLILVASICFWNETSNMPSPESIYPKVVIGFLTFFTILAYLKDLLKKSPELRHKMISKNSILVILGIGCYIICISAIGYFFTTYCYLIIFFQCIRYSKQGDYLETRSLFIDSLLSLCVTSFIALLFKVFLKLVFPESWMF